MIQVLSDLREPPVVGQFYIVPVVHDFPYFGRVDAWPVLGALHKDDDFFHFPYPHYHIDARFLTKAQIRHIETPYRGLIDWIGGSPLMNTAISLPKGRPVLARRKCQMSSYGHGHQDKQAVKDLNAHFGAPAQPIRRADGRLLCPHRKADLSQFHPDADGTVLCPLHGLRVCVGAAERVAS